MNSNGKKYNVAGLGEVLWDLFPDAKKLGGAPANFCSHAQQLGAKSFILSSVGEDVLGKKATALLQQSKIDTTGLQINKHFPTGRVRVELDSNGNPDYTIEDNVAWDYIKINTSQKKIAQQLDALCFGTLAQRNPDSQKSIFKIIATTPPNCLRVFDVNFRKNFYDFPMVRQSLNLANIVKMNQQEFTEIVEMFSLPKNHKKGLDSLIKKFQLKMCILTLGDKGAIMATKKEYSCIVPIKTIKVLSTVGAGDSFTAAAIMGWLNKKPLDQINQEASRLAAYVCGQLEAVPSIIH